MKGFISLPLIAYVAIFAGIAVTFGAMQTYRLKAKTAQYDSFVAVTKAAGEEAKRNVVRQMTADQKNKERTDAENRNLRNANAALTRSLLNARTSRGYVPAASPGARDPDRACFSRADLERAFQQLDAGVSQLVGEGDQARIGLDSVKVWAKER